MQYSDMSWLQKVAFKTGKFLTENKTVQKVTEAPVIKQAGQVLGMTFDQGRYLQRKQEKELNLAKQETIDEKAAYDKLVSDKNIQAQLSRDALTYNPKINDVVQAGKNVASLSNSLFSQALARIDKSTTQDWLGMTDEQRKGYKSIWDYKTASLINYAKKDTASRQVLTDPAVTQYIAYRNKIEQAGSKMNFREKLGGFGQGLVSPYMVTVNTLDSIAGEISGKKARQTRAKKDFASYFGRTDLMQNAASITYKELGTEYLTRQMGWMDLFPVLGPAVEGVAKISKVGKYGKLGVGLIESGESAIKAIGSSNIKTAFNLDPALKKFAQESKFAFEKAKEADMFKFIQDNPGIKSPLLEKLRKVVPEDLVKHVDELDSSVTKYASTFKYPKNTAKEIVKSFYMMTPNSLKVPGTMFGVQVGTEALAEVTGNDSFREVGSVLTNPAAGIVHMMGRGKSAYSDRAYKEYAEGYGYTVDELKALPDDDPLKKEINQTIDMMYNNTTFSQAVGILPKSTLGKLGAGLMDSILAFGGMAGISKAGSYGMKKAGLSNINLAHPTDKDGNLKIKMFQDIETRIGKIEDLDQQQAALEKELQTILANDKPIGIIEGTKIARLLDESAQRMKDLGEIASQVYGTKTIGGILAKYDQAVELLRSGEPTDYVRGQATQLMKEARNGMTSLVETTQKTTGADQFTKEYMQAQNRFMMSAAALFNLRDMEGLQASVTKKAIKMSAKSYNSRGRMILEGEVIKNFATVRDGAFQASHIANTFKGLEREANVLKEMYKLQTEGDFTYKRWMNQEVDHAINKRIAAQLSNIKDSEAYEKLFNVIKAEVVNTVHYGVFFSRKDGMKPNELETISNSILKKIFMGNSFKKDSPLGSALSKIGPKTSAGDSIIKDVIDGAAKLSYQVFGEKMQEYTKDKEFRINHVKDMIQGLQGISQVQKSLNILMRMRSFTDMANSPLEMKAMGMEMTKEQEDKMFELAKGEVDVGTIDTLKNIREQFDDEAISNMDVDTQSTYLIKGLDIIDTALEKQSEAIVKMENEQKDMTNQINSINKAVNEVVGLPVASKIDGKVSPEDAAYKKDMVAMMNSAKSFVSNVQRDTTKADLDDIVSSERGEVGDNIVNIEKLYPSSFIINSIGAKAKKDASFVGTRGKNNVETDTMIDIVKSSNENNFIDKVLTSAGYDKDAIAYIKQSDKYSEDLRNIKNKFDNFKDGVDINARTIFYNADGTINEAKSMEKNIQQESKGLQHLGDMGKDVKYISASFDIPIETKEFGKRQEEREANVRAKLGTDNILILKNDTRSDFISIPKDSVRKSALKDIGKELDDNQLEQYAHLKNAGVVDRLLREGQTNPEVLKILTDANPAVWTQIQLNISKYPNKINSHNIKVNRPISSIVLKDGKSQIDGTYFIVDPILQNEGRRAKFIGNQPITGMKAGSAELGFLLKGFGEFGNKENIKELIASDKENIERLQTILGTTETKAAKLADLLWEKVEAGEVSMIIPDTSIKESMKNIEGYPKELLKTNSKEIFQITDLRLYPQVSTLPHSGQIKVPLQYKQTLAGEKGDIIKDSFKDYVEKDIESPQGYVLRVFELFNQGDFVGAQKILSNNLHKFSRDDIEGILELADGSGNIFGASSKQLQGLLKRLLEDNITGDIMKGIARTVSGVPIRHDTIIKKTFGLPDSYYTVISKKLFDKNWKTGDHVLFGTNPTTGPKATMALKVIFIEDLPKEIQDYYKIYGNDKMNAYIPLEIADQFTTKQGNVVSKTPGRGAERDFDGDQINLITDFAKSKPVRGEHATIGDLMYEYTKEIADRDITWDISKKGGFKEYLQSFGNAALKATTPSFMRLNSKVNVGITASKQRIRSTALRPMHENLKDSDMIEFTSAMQKPIQDSVDSSLLNDPSEKLVNDFYFKAFEGLFIGKGKREKEALLKELNSLHGSSKGIFQYVQGKTGERSKLLKEYISGIKGSLEAYDKLVELKAKSNINMKVKAGGVSKDKAESMLAQEKARLLKLNEGSSHVSLNILKKIPGIQNYDTKDNKHWINKIENNINNAKALQSGIFFTLLSKEMPDISAYKGKKVIDDMKLWGDYEGAKRWEIKDDPALDTAMQDKNAALFALSTNNYHVLPYVQKYHPDVIEAWANIRKHSTMNEGRTDMVATIIGTQNKYAGKELKFFGKGDQSTRTLTYWNYIAKLALGDFEGANAILKSTGKSEKDFTKEFNTEEYSHLEDATMSMVQDTMKTDDTIPTTENKSQEIVYRKIVNDFLKKEIDNIQVNMDKLGSAYNAKNTLIRDMYQYYKNTDANLLAKRDDPLKSFIRTLPNGDKLYEAGQIQTFFRQAIESMKDVIPADLIQKRIQFEQQGKAKQYESDLGKTFKKNSRDVAIESMKEIRRVHALEMHEVNLKLWNEVRDVIIADPKFAASVTKYMGEIVRANPKMNREQARENAIQEMINQTSKDTANRLTQETQDKIREMTNAQLSKLGEVTSKIIGNVSQQMRDTSIFTEAPETLGRFLSMKMDNILIDKALKEGNASDTLGAFMQFLNTTYKSTMLSYAPGRLLTEGTNSLFQTWIPSVTSWTHQKWNQLTGKPSVVGLRLHSEQAFLNKMGRDSIDLPNIGELGYAGIMKRFPEFNKASTKVFQQRSKRGESQKQSHLEKLTNVIGHNKIIEFLTSKSATVNGKRIPLGFESASQIMKEKLFTHEFYTNLHDIIIHRSESNPAYMEKAKRLLTTIDQNLSKEERFQKKALLKETERLSTKNVKENFFDYTNNPIRVAGLETYVPFANFFYNSVKIMAKRPLAWLGLMTSVGNIMQDFSYPEFDVDEESLRGYYNTHKFSISILGALGFANAGVDLKRFLPIDLTNPKFFGYSYQKMFFPTNDSDFTRLMEDKNFHRYNYGLKKIAPAIGDLVSGITTNDDKSFRRRLMYMFTGLSWNDTAKFDMLKAYYKQDYSEMLNKNSYYWNQFNVRREKNGLPKMTKEDVASKKYFDELIFNGDSEGYKYLNVMADYVTYTEFVKNKSGDFFTDTDSAKAVNTSVRSMLMDMATDELRGKETTDGQSEGLKLYEKANKLNELTIDENGVTRKKKAGEKSILERMRSLGTMDEFLDRLEYYAKDYKVISQFSEANQKRWTDEGTINDNAKVAAFKYYFQEEEKDPKRAKLESENYELYYKTKVDAIMNGTLRHPIYTEVQDEVASDIAITDGYKKRLQYGKGLILTDLEKAKNNVNSYTLLKNIYRKQYNSATNPGMQSYRKSLAQRASEQVQKERNRFETLSPTFYNLNQLKSTVSNMGPASTYAEELENYKIAIAERTKKSFANYYTGKKTWYNKLLNDKGATLQFKQNNGITIEDAMNQLDFNLQTNGLSSQTTSEQTYVSF